MNHESMKNLKVLAVAVVVVVGENHNRFVVNKSGVEVFVVVNTTIF